MKMKLSKTVASIVVVVFVIAMMASAYAANENMANGAENGRPEADRNLTTQGIGQDLSPQIHQVRAEIRAGDYTGPLGQQMNVRDLAEQWRELRVNGVAAQTDLNISVEKDAEGKAMLRTKLRNGMEKDIKIMPDTAAAKALLSLGLKTCSPEKNCTMQLKDVGSGQTEQLRYEVQIERHSRILGVFPTQMHVRADVDAETGDTVVHKPWWAFIATEPEE